MILLKKKNKEDYFEFDKILASGYRITEQQNEINKVQMVNGKRKKILTTYIDVVIEIDLGCFDGDTLAEYISNLTDGEYQYYSLKDKTYKNVNFIATIPQQIISNCADDVYVEDFTVTLEKSSDVS